MPFPIVVGDVTFTLDQFEGRAYVFGYPYLLQTFANRGLGGDKLHWLGTTFVTGGNPLAPSWGPIDIRSGGFQPSKNQPVAVLDSNNTILMVINVTGVTSQLISGEVIYISKNFTRPVTAYRLGLPQTFTTDPPDIIGGLERLPWWLDGLKNYGSVFENRMMGAYFSDSKFTGNATYGPGLITNEDGGSFHAADNTKYVEWAGKELPLTYPFGELVWRFKAKSNGLKCTIHPNCILTKSGTSISVNGSGVAGTYPNSVYHVYEFRVLMTTSTSGSVEVYLNGTLVRTVSLATSSDLGFKLEGPFEAVDFSVRVYHV